MPPLTLPTGKFFDASLLSADSFFQKSFFSKNSFRIIIRVSNCLQRLSADDTSRQRVKQLFAGAKTGISLLLIWPVDLSVQFAF